MAKGWVKMSYTWGKNISDLTSHAEMHFQKKSFFKMYTETEIEIEFWYEERAAIF